MLSGRGPHQPEMLKDTSLNYIRSLIYFKSFQKCLYNPADKQTSKLTFFSSKKVIRALTLKQTMRAKNANV